MLDHHPKQGHGPYFEGGKRRIFDPKGLQDVDEDGVDGPYDYLFLLINPFYIQL